jgi:hypothetical protein
MSKLPNGARLGRLGEHVAEINARLSMHERYCGEREARTQQALAEIARRAGETRAALHRKLDALAQATDARFAAIDRGIARVQWWLIGGLLGAIGATAAGAFWLGLKLARLGLAQ